MEISELVSKNLRVIREERGLTQRFIAENCDVSTQTIRDIEAGRRGLSLELLGRVAHALGIKATDLLNTSEAAPVLQMPVSKTLLKLAAIPDGIYDLAERVSKTNDVWKDIETFLEQAAEKEDNKKSSGLNKA